MQILEPLRLALNVSAELTGAIRRHVPTKTIIGSIWLRILIVVEVRLEIIGRDHLLLHFRIPSTHDLSQSGRGI